MGLIWFFWWCGGIGLYYCSHYNAGAVNGYNHYDIKKATMGTIGTDSSLFIFQLRLYEFSLEYIYSPGKMHTFL